jgi:hypothetical protein
MTDQNTKKNVVKRLAGEISGPDALAALTQLVNATRESIEIHETESTKREKLKTYRETEVRRIKSSEKALREYFDRIFAERRETHTRLFASLDLALESGDTVALQTIVGGIVEVAKTSPLSGIGNIAELKQAMQDPDAVFDL